MISLDRMVQKHAAKSKQNHILINEKILIDMIYKSHNKGGEAKNDYERRSCRQDGSKLWIL